MAPIIGRESEIAVVEAFLGDDRRARVLAIVGEAGIGKTTVWEHAVLRARESDAAVLVARPTESEAKLSFAALTDILAPVPPGLVASLPTPQRKAIDVVLLKAEAARPPGRRLVGTAVLSVLRALAAERAVVLAVDDVHWLDGPSASAVEFAIRRLADEPVRTIVSLRPEAERAGPVGLAGELFERLELGPLSVAALHRIIGEALSRTFPRPTLVRIARASGGNPFYALEIARLLDRKGAHADRRRYRCRRICERSSLSAWPPCRVGRGRHSSVPPRWRDPISASSTPGPSPRRRRQGSCGSAATGASSSPILFTPPRSTHPRR